MASLTVAAFAVSLHAITTSNPSVARDFVTSFPIPPFAPVIKTVGLYAYETVETLTSYSHPTAAAARLPLSYHAKNLSICPKASLYDQALDLQLCNFKVAGEMVR